MAYKISDLVGQSPSLEITSPAGTELIEVSEPQGTSPETYVTKYVQQTNIGGGGGSTAEFVEKTANYTLILTDAGKVVYCDITGSPLSDITITIPTNASVAFATGTLINVVIRENDGAALSPANKVTITGDTGVTVNGVSAGSVDLTGTYSGVALQKVASDTWVVV